MAQKTIVIPCPPCGDGSPVALVDCAGAAIAPNTAIAKCTDIQTLQTVISSMQLQITNLNTIITNLLASTDTIMDCNGNPIATVYVKT